MEYESQEDLLIRISDELNELLSHYELKGDPANAHERIMDELKSKQGTKGIPSDRFDRSSFYSAFSATIKGKIRHIKEMEEIGHRPYFFSKDRQGLFSEARRRYTSYNGNPYSTHRNL